MEFLPKIDLNLEEIEQYNQAYDPVQYKANRLKQVRKNVINDPWAVYQLLFKQSNL